MNEDSSRFTEEETTDGFGNWVSGDEELEKNVHELLMGMLKAMGGSFDWAIPQYWWDECHERGLRMNGQVVWLYSDLLNSSNFGTPFPVTLYGLKSLSALSNINSEQENKLRFNMEISIWLIEELKYLLGESQEEATHVLAMYNQAERDRNKILISSVVSILGESSRGIEDLIEEIRVEHHGEVEKAIEFHREAVIDIIGDKCDSCDYRDCTECDLWGIIQDAKDTLDRADF